MKIIHHKNLFKDYLQYNAWKSEESFPILKENKQIIDELIKYEIVAYVFEGMQSERNESNFAKLITVFKKEILELLSQDKGLKYIFAIEHNSSPISKLRSYKGFVNSSEVGRNLLFEKEIFISNHESRFAFISVLTESNFTYFTKFIFDNHYCFLISTENNYANEILLEKIVSLFPLKGTTHINFLNVIIEFCKKGDFVYRIGGNDGEEYWSLQVAKEK